MVNFDWKVGCGHWPRKINSVYQPQILTGMDKGAATTFLALFFTTWKRNYVLK